LQVWPGAQSVLMEQLVRHSPVGPLQAKGLQLCVPLSMQEPEPLQKSAGAEVIEVGQNAATQTVEAE